MSPLKLSVKNKDVFYNVRYSKRAKYLQLRITHSNDLELVIPKRCSLKDGEKFLFKKLDWIEKHYSKRILQKNAYFFFGEEINIKQNFNLFIRKHSVKFNNNELLVESPSESKSSQEEIYFAFLKNYAGKYLINRTDALAEKFGFTVNKVFIRGQKTRWGSCSSKGNLSFNYTLMKYRKEVIDYVIIHELCHLREMNHSGNFWLLVEKFCPDYKILKKELKNKPINI